MVSVSSRQLFIHGSAGDVGCHVLHEPGERIKPGLHAAARDGVQQQVRDAYRLKPRNHFQHLVF